MSCVEKNELMEAINSWNSSTLQMLVEKGLDPNFRISNKGYSLLHYAVGHCDINIVLFLLQKNADPNIRSVQLLTPVHLCVHWDFDVPLRLLLAYGGDPYLCDSTGKSSFEIASQERSLKCLKVLENVNSPNTCTDMMVSDLGYSQCTSFSESKDNCILDQAFIHESSHKELYTFVSQGNVNGIPSLEYLYQDPEENITFWESRLSGTSTISTESPFSSTTSSLIVENNGVSETDSIDEVLSELKRKSECSLNPLRANHDNHYSSPSNSEIREQLIKLGKNPGPVTENTRCVYLKLLASIKSANMRDVGESTQQSKSIPASRNKCEEFAETFPRLDDSPLTPDSKRNFLLGYPEELRAFAIKAECICQEKYMLMEKDLVCDFDEPRVKWREGNQKTAFNYLLLDSRLTRNFTRNPMKASKQLEIFVRSVFYVGKGSRSRPLSHLYEAAKSLRSGKENEACAKVTKICDIWKSGNGVLNLQCFHNVIPAEAYTRESLMICALGLRNITNLRRGECYGLASRWSLKKKRRFGAYLLYRALQLLIYDGERQIRFADLNPK